MTSINKNSSREDVIKAVKTYGLDLLSADERFKADREIVLAAVKSNGSIFEDIDWMQISALCMNAWKDACSKKQMAFHKMNKAMFESFDLEDSGIEISEDKRKADKKLFDEWKLLNND